MSRDPPPYRRAVLGMGAGGVDRDVLRTVAEFARLLHLEMLGLFIEDRSLLALAALPFARELRLPGHDWRALEAQGIGDELRAAALRARKLFEEEFEPRGIAYSFEVQRGDPAILSGSLARATDILIVVEPHAAEIRIWMGTNPVGRRNVGSGRPVAASLGNASPRPHSGNSGQQLGPIVPACRTAGGCYGREGSCHTVGRSSLLGGAAGFIAPCARLPPGTPAHPAAGGRNARRAAIGTGGTAQSADPHHEH